MYYIQLLFAILSSNLCSTSHFESLVKCCCIRGLFSLTTHCTLWLLNLYPSFTLAVRVGMTWYSLEFSTFKCLCLITIHKVFLCRCSKVFEDYSKKYSPPSPSLSSAFTTSVSDQARASVSIKLCSLWDDIYVRGQLIFSQ